MALYSDMALALYYILIFAPWWVVDELSSKKKVWDNQRFTFYALIMPALLCMLGVKHEIDGFTYP
jgi:hypothetical protein